MISKPIDLCANSPATRGRILNGFLVASLCLLLAACGSTPKSGAPVSMGHTESGVASFYGNEFQSRKTSNGEVFDQRKFTAAHQTLPFGTKLRVTNSQNGKSVFVRINDRGPFARGRIIDLSSAAFKTIANPNVGVINVKIEVVP